MIGELVRTPEEIKEMCVEIREYQDHHSLRFEVLTYEQGVQAAIMWLFYQQEPSPVDVDVQSRKPLMERNNE